MAPTPNGPRTATAGIVVVIAVASLILVTTAWADHYHIAGWYGGSGNSLMHGNEPNDEIWHGRTTPVQVTGEHLCGAGDEARGIVVMDKNNSSGNCTATLRRNYFISNSRECLSYGYGDYPNAGIGEHTHRAHSYGVCPLPS